MLDNFEHLLEGADLIAEILQAAPEVKILATSRERLRLPGEHVFPIHGLEYGSADAAGSGTLSRGESDCFCRARNVSRPTSPYPMRNWRRLQRSAG